MMITHTHRKRKCMHITFICVHTIIEHTHEKKSPGQSMQQTVACA
jgi:hypothetical protein